MKQDVKEYVEQKVKEMLDAPSCCADAKNAGQAWLDALGTDAEAAKTKELIEELEQDIMPLEGLIAFAGSEAGTKIFGAEKAKAIEAHAKEQKEAGEKYCDCPACAAVAAILEKKAEME